MANCLPKREIAKRYCAKTENFTLLALKFGKSFERPREEALLG
jgi:hypothetical protein